MKWLAVLLLATAVSSAPHNPDENRRIRDPNLFEGDMLLTPEERRSAELGLDVDKPNSLKRGSARSHLWPNGVVIYDIQPDLASNSRAMEAIRAGMEEWTTKTCIRFKKRTHEKYYAYFKDGSGCSSWVGRMKSHYQPQSINLPSGCWYKGTVAHEIGHAVGFWHEQSRPDRDDFVTVLWDNIKEGHSHNFKKYPRSTIDSLGTPYDYGSLMHYGRKYFSKNNQETLKPKQEGAVIGQRDALSDIDAQQANLLYKSVCRKRLEGCDMSPVGISYPSIIPDKQMTASSQYSNHYQPFYGRLHGLRGDGWCSKYPDRNDDWLQVDLGETVHVCAVATQGDVDGNEWVTDFKLSYSSDGNNWTPYKDGNGREVEFHREGDSYKVDRHKLAVPLTARYIRFHPTKRHAWNCLRVEVYSTDRTKSCGINTVGISDKSIIPDGQMTASSQYSDNYQPFYGRLHGERGDGWCSKTANGDEDWLQVDLGKTTEVCAVATQGDINGNEWITDFKLSYSSDGNKWTTYKDKNGAEVEFHREGFSHTVDEHKLPEPVSARYIRFHPTRQHAWNCLRVEVYSTKSL